MNHKISAKGIVITSIILISFLAVLIIVITIENNSKDSEDHMKIVDIDGNSQAIIWISKNDVWCYNFDSNSSKNVFDKGGSNYKSSVYRNKISWVDYGDSYERYGNEPVPWEYTFYIYDILTEDLQEFEYVGFFSDFILRENFIILEKWSYDGLFDQIDLSILDLNDNSEDLIISDSLEYAISDESILFINSVDRLQIYNIENRTLEDLNITIEKYWIEHQKNTYGLSITKDYLTFASFDPNKKYTCEFFLFERLSKNISMIGEGLDIESYITDHNIVWSKHDSIGFIISDFDGNIIADSIASGLFIDLENRYGWISLIEDYKVYIFTSNFDGSNYRKN